MEDFDPDLNYEFFNQTGHQKCDNISLSQYLEFSFCLNDLSIINLNIRSFHANFDRFSALFSYDEMPSILVLTENRKFIFTRNLEKCKIYFLRYKVILDFYLFGL